MQMRYQMARFMFVATGGGVLEVGGGDLISRRLTRVSVFSDLTRGTGAWKFPRVAKVGF